MKYDAEGHWFSLPKPWSELPDQMRANAIETAGEILTYDKGLLIKIDGRWEIVRSGDHSDAEVVLNALRKPN
ncbi:MAG: hypothetical protein EOS72_02990 [Mesorhizobium sp.]|uniref:hypothetical protein n=1 Tax=Mesorhizobium sp. TaxID=1871066 RepID=UPI000FE728CC|nr:hypothetical protein [Mesorhizobium sp.]RWC91637.1 MAG: hypothetical protein EOS72_02990 [Mesorhizobium sp.]